MLTHALIALAALGPTDSPIEPIPAVVVEVAIDSGLMADVCDLYGAVIPIFSDALNGDTLLAIDITDAYAISMFEEGYDETGTSRMTLEATEAFTEYLHGCAL